MVSKTLAFRLPVMSLLVLAGCGGGGGGSNSPMPQQNLQSARAPSQPMEIASTTLTATDSSGNTWTATYSSTAGGMAMFNGQNATTSAITLTVAENGAVVATEDSTAYYLTNPYSPLGLSGTTSGVAWTAVINSYTPLPSMLLPRAVPSGFGLRLPLSSSQFGTEWSGTKNTQHGLLVVATLPRLSLSMGE